MKINQIIKKILSRNYSIDFSHVGYYFNKPVININNLKYINCILPNLIELHLSGNQISDISCFENNILNLELLDFIK